MTSYYGLSAGSILLGNANQLTDTGGGSSTTPTTGTETMDYGGWIQVWSHGGAPTVNGAIGSPNGRGFILDSAALEGVVVPSGVWSVKLTPLTSASSAVGDMVVRIYDLDYFQAIYTEIGEAIQSGITVPTTGIDLTFSTDSLGQYTFGGSGHKLYLDIWWHQLGGGSFPNLMSLKVASTSSGVPGAVEIILPSEAPPPPPSSGGSFAASFSARSRIASSFVGTSRIKATYSKTSRIKATFTRSTTMAQPNSTTEVTATLTLPDGTHPTISTITVGVTFPDGSTGSYSLVGGQVTSLGSGQYKLKYTSKGPGVHTELWTFTASDGSVGEYQNHTPVNY